MGCILPFVWEFKQDVCNSDATSTKIMVGMFVGATRFHQDISKWDTSSITTIGSVFSDTPVSN